MIHLRFDRAALVAGEPCVEVTPVNDGTGSINHHKGTWSGFEATRGVLFIKATGGHAWMEYHGEDSWIGPGGRFIDPQPVEHEPYGHNWFPAGQLDLIRADHSLVYGAVNLPRVLQDRTAVTVYQWLPEVITPSLVPSARFEAVSGKWLRSVVVAAPTDMRPLTVWVETNCHKLVEYG